MVIHESRTALFKVPRIKPQGDQIEEAREGGQMLFIQIEPLRAVQFRDGQSVYRRQSVLLG
jgi:hypothetical protein